MSGYLLILSQLRSVTLYNVAFNSESCVCNFATMKQDIRPEICIKLKPYLQEYLRCKLNDSELLATRNNIIGSFLRPFLQYVEKEKNPNCRRLDPEWITFKLPHFHDIDSRNNSLGMTMGNMKFFELILEIHFKDVFFSYMDDKVRYMHDNGKRGAIKRC